MRSKETERESDWTDISQLEEIADSRRLADLQGNPNLLTDVLANLRSRRGMDTAIARGLTDDRSVAGRSIQACRHPVTFAFLLPLVSKHMRDSVLPTGARLSINATALAALKTAEFKSPKHFNLIEICRRAYKRSAMDADRADKQKSLEKHRQQGS